MPHRHPSVESIPWPRPPPPCAPPHTPSPFFPPPPPPLLQYGVTPLHVAAMYGHAPVVALLLATPGVHPLAETKTVRGAQRRLRDPPAFPTPLPSAAVCQDFTGLCGEVWKGRRSRAAAGGPARRSSSSSSSSSSSTQAVSRGRCLCSRSRGLPPQEQHRICQAACCLPSKPRVERRLKIPQRPCARAAPGFCGDARALHSVHVQVEEGAQRGAGLPISDPHTPSKCSSSSLGRLDCHILAPLFSD